MEGKSHLFLQAVWNSYWEARLAPRDIERLAERREAERLTLILREALPPACSGKIRLDPDYGIVTYKSKGWLVTLRVATDEDRRCYEVSLQRGSAGKLLTFDDSLQACEGFARAAGEVGEEWVEIEPGWMAKAFKNLLLTAAVILLGAAGTILGGLLLHRFGC